MKVRKGDVLVREDGRKILIFAANIYQYLNGPNKGKTISPKGWNMRYLKIPESGWRLAEESIISRVLNKYSNDDENV